MSTRSCWILIEDFAGMRAQALGLADHLPVRAEERTLRPLFPWRHIAAAAWPNARKAIAPEALALPFPDLAIGCGGKSAAVLAALRRECRVVIVQHPRMDIRKFDLVLAARHDDLTGPNVLVTRTALHRITPETLAAAAEKWRDAFAAVARPLVAVLVGGSNGRFTLDAASGAALAEQIARMMRVDGAGVVLTTSRRTSPEVAAILRNKLEPLGAWVWNGIGDNPYQGMLALADAIVVTVDSVSMLSEAVATRAPVFTVRLPGRSKRIDRFVQSMIDDRRIRPYQGRFEAWAVEPINDTPEAAAELARRFGY